MPTLPTDPAVGAWPVLLLVVVTAVPVLLGTRPVLVRLREPPEAEGKLPYRALATGRFVGACTVLSAAGAALAGLALPAATWPLWWVLGTFVLVLGAVDARTTWVPLRPTHVAWAAALGAGVLVFLLGGPGLLGRSALGAGVAWLFFEVFWRVSRGGIGYGDVRLAPLIGAATAAVGWPTFVASLLLGSLVGAAVGVVRLVRRRPGAFAYAPSMLAGAYLAGALRLVTG